VATFDAITIEGLNPDAYTAEWNYTPIPTPFPDPTQFWFPDGDVNAAVRSAWDHDAAGQSYDATTRLSVQRYFFYDKIYIHPERLDLGAVAADLIRQVSIWNAFFVTKTLESITGTGLDGISVSLGGSLPYAFPPLGFTVADIEISSSEGPFTIDAVYNFNFADETISVEITGSRAQIWAYGHNWDTPIEETLSYLSAVRVAYAGIEHRAALRSIPRRSQSVSLFEEDDALRELETKLFGWQARLFLVPLQQYPSKTTAPALSGQPVIPFDTADRGLVEGAYVVIEDLTTGTRIPASIAEVAAHSITLTSNLTGTLAVGTRLWPAHPAMADEQVSLNWHLPSFATGKINFEFIPVETWGGALAADPPQLYRGEEVYTIEPDWVTGLAVQSTQTFGVTESVAGKKKRNERWLRPSRQYPFGWLLRGFSEIARFREFVQRRLGRTVSFWMPSFRADLQLADPVISIAAVSINVVDGGYLAFSAGNNQRKNISIELKNGTVMRRRILSATYDSPNVTSLSLDAALGYEFTPDDVFRISFLSRYRLGSDEVKLVWYNPSVVTCDMPVVAVPDSPEQDSDE